MKREGEVLHSITRPPPPRCFRYSWCNHTGHWVVMCPFVQQKSGTDRPWERPYTARSADAEAEELGMDDVMYEAWQDPIWRADPTEIDRLWDLHRLSERHAVYPRRKLPVILCAGIGATTAKCRLTLVKGRVGCKKVNVLRGTGCTTVIVKAAYVKDSEYTGRPVRIRLLDNTAKGRSQWEYGLTPHT